MLDYSQQLPSTQSSHRKSTKVELHGNNVHDIIIAHVISAGTHVHTTNRCGKCKAILGPADCEKHTLSLSTYNTHRTHESLLPANSQPQGTTPVNLNPDPIRIPRKQTSTVIGSTSEMCWGLLCSPPHWQDESKHHPTPLGCFHIVQTNEQQSLQALHGTALNYPLVCPLLVMPMYLWAMLLSSLNTCLCCIQLPCCYSD